MAVRLICRTLLLARGPAETRDTVFRDRVSDGAVLEDRRNALYGVSPFRWALAMIVGSGFLTEIHGGGRSFRNANQKPTVVAPRISLTGNSASSHQHSSQSIEPAKPNT
jgi:hypothetical protein